MNSIESLKKLLDNKEVDVAVPDSYRKGRYDKVDKEVLK